MHFGLSSGLLAHRIISPFLAMPITKTLKKIIAPRKTNNLVPNLNAAKTLNDGKNADTLKLHNNEVQLWLSQIQGK